MTSSVCPARPGRATTMDTRSRDSERQEPTQVTHNRTLTRLARGLTSGALALTVLGWGGGAIPPATPRPALADDMDCYTDADVYDTDECVQKRADDAANGVQPAATPEPQAQQQAPDPT